MKVELDVDEVWELMSRIVARLTDEAGFSAGDKAKVRRWRSDSMRPGSDEMELLARKVNEDLMQAVGRKRRSAIRKPDWR